MMRSRRLVFITALLAAALAPSAPALAQTQPKPKSKPGAAASAPPAAATVGVYAKRYAELCAACHGANGRGEMVGTPVLAGQYSLYAITQLFLFREGRRSNEAMTAIAKGMKDDDLRGFSEYIGTLAAIPAPTPAAPPDAARMAKGQALAQQHKCVFCHGADFSGGEQVPRIGGQREDYLLMSLQGFKNGTRPGYTRAMTEALSQVPAADLDTLAYYAARVPVAAR